MSLLSFHHATICKYTLQYNSYPAIFLKQLTSVATGAIACCVRGLSVVMSQVQRWQERNIFSTGQMAFLLIIKSHTHACTWYVVTIWNCSQTVNFTHFLTQLPDVTSELQNVQNSIGNVSLNQLIEEGQQQFDNISQLITTTVDENLDG